MLIFSREAALEHEQASMHHQIGVCAGLALSTLLASGFFVQASAGNAEIMIKGYDPVSYFSESGPQVGSKKLIEQHNGHKYAFSSRENAEKFRANPDRYVPQYGGNCAVGMAYGNRASVNPKIWNIADGKLYLYLSAASKHIWSKKKRDYIKRAEAAWKALNAQ